MLPIPLAVLGAVSYFAALGGKQTYLYEFEKFMCFAAAFVLGTKIESEKPISAVLFITAAVTAAVGLAAYCAPFGAGEFVFKDGGIFRLQSFFKYANTAACFLACGYFAFLEIYVQNPRKLWLCGGSIILTALYLTFSKALIPVFLIIGTLYIYKNRAAGGIFAVQNVFAAVSAVITAFFAVKFNALAVLSAEVLAVCLSAAVSEKSTDSDKNYFGICCASLAFLAVAAIVLLFFKPSLGITFIKRLGYMRDSLKLLSVNPLLGCGFGSWRVLQYGVQNEQYNVTYLHNGILQFLVENGVLFTAVFVGIFAKAFWDASKRGKYAFAASAAIIFLHSLADFDLSFGAVLLTSGIMAGNSISPKKPCLSGKKRVCAYAAEAFLALFLCTVCTYMTAEYVCRYSFEKSYLDSDLDKAADKAEILSKICPSDADLKITEAALAEKRGRDAKTVREKIERAHELSPHDREIYESLIKTAADAENAEEMCETYMDMAPKQESTYAFLKSFLKQMNESDRLGDEEYRRLAEITERRRISEGVIDRNELLKKITKNK